MDVDNVECSIWVPERMYIPDLKSNIFQTSFVGGLFGQVEDVRERFKVENLTIMDEGGKVRRDGSWTTPHIEKIHVRF